MAVATKKKAVKYPEIKAVLRANHVKAGGMSVQQAKDMIGWEAEPKNDDWGSEYFFRDLHGRKIRLANNTTNRPFRMSLAKRYQSEHLRGKWSLNLETIVVAAEGKVLQGQHRLVGFILADMQRELDPKQWGDKPLVFEVLLGFGVSSKPANANTYDLGIKRSLGDVIFRHQKFKVSLSDKEKKKVSGVLAGAIRLVWLRSGGLTVSSAPHFPHSEALEFYGKHPGILDAVVEIVKLDEGEEGNEKCIGSLISLGYASALLYMMNSATSEKKATKFWELFATGEGLENGSPILSLKKVLIKAEAGGGKQRDAIIGMVVKTWNLYLKGKSGTTKEIKVVRKKVDDKIVLAECPRIGGIDSDVKAPDSLTQHQLLILNVLGKSKTEMNYKSISDLTGIQSGAISRATIKENGQGTENLNSLEEKGLVKVSQYEPVNGEKVAPYWFELSAKGKQLSK